MSLFDVRSEKRLYFDVIGGSNAPLLFYNPFRPHSTPTRGRPSGGSGIAHECAMGTCAWPRHLNSSVTSLCMCVWHGVSLSLYEHVRASTLSAAQRHGHLCLSRLPPLAMAHRSSCIMRSGEAETWSLARQRRCCCGRGSHSISARAHRGAQAAALTCAPFWPAAARSHPPRSGTG